MFPIIQHIDDVLPHIEGKDEFNVTHKDDYTVIQYAVMTPETFPPIIGTDKEKHAARIMRECRGLIFDKKGKLISRRYHKFFNVNEREETLAKNLDFTKPHVILDKLDGSMITPMHFNGIVRWGTKRGLSDVAFGAEAFVATRPKYVEFARYCWGKGLTPIFEFCSNANRIVLAHAKDDLILTGVRDMETGIYVNYTNMSKIAEDYDIPCVKVFTSGTDSIEDFLGYVNGLEENEGVIVRWDDGNMVKVKTAWYVLRHKSKDAITREKNVIQYIVDGQVDDVKPFLTEEDGKTLVEFEKKFWKVIAKVAERYEMIFQDVYDNFGADRKAYATSGHWTVTGYDGDHKVEDEMLPTIVFRMMNGHKARDLILDYIRRNYFKQVRIDAIRYLWDNHAWSYEFFDES